MGLNIDRKDLKLEPKLTNLQTTKFLMRFLDPVGFCSSLSTGPGIISAEIETGFREPRFLSPPILELGKPVLGWGGEPVLQIILGE